MLQELLQLNVKSKENFMVWIELHLIISFKKQLLKKEKLTLMSYQKFRFSKKLIHTEKNKFVMLYLKNVLNLNHIFVSKDKKAIDSISLLKVSSLQKKVKIINLLKKYLNIKPETISVKLL
jgi:hypothetical protein